MQLPSSFARDGFDVSVPETPKRLLIGTQGLERVGKTDWGLRTAQEPIIYIGLDFGHEGVIEKHAKHRAIAKYVVNVPPVASQDKYLGIWKTVNDRINKAINNQDVRTVIYDTGTDLWELLRLAEFGSLTKSGDTKQLYRQINQAYKSLIKMAYDREINLIVTHKVKKLYKTRTVQTNKGPQTQEYWDGESYERAGFGEGGYLVQCQIEHLFDANRGKTLQDRFGIRVLDCRQNMDIVGLELWGADNSFPVLATYVFEDTNIEDWQ